ncbi:hypothetical protein OIV83_002704 [Microbotryomycetes sp. JL201]|nr:hypothetical protein OIV83_002704 [Microbotryomycetes sp. JL201]
MSYVKPSAECQVFLDNFPLPLPTGDHPDKALRPFLAAAPPPPAPDPKLCKVETFTIPGPASTDLRLFVVRPNNDESVPVVMVFHGGGAICGVPEMDLPLLEHLAKAGFAAVAVDYRLAPEYPFPAQFDDAETAWNYVQSKEAVSKLNIDHSKVILYGSSAGSWISQGLTHRLCKSGKSSLPRLVALDSTLADDRLIYPMQADNHPLAKFYVWSVQNSRDSHRYVHNDGEAPLEAALLRSTDPKDFAGFPPFYVNSCELDSLADHGPLLATKLREAGVSVEQHIYRGATHAFSSLMPASSIAQALYAELVRVFKQALE